MNYKLLVEVAILTGDIMLKHGAETYRVEDTMTRILNCAKLSYAEAYVTYTGIVVTLDDPKIESITRVKRIGNTVTNLNKIYLANDISRDLCEGRITVEEAYKRLQELREVRIYKELTLAMGTIITAASFALLLGGMWYDCLISAVNGVFIVFCHKLAKKLNQGSFIDYLVSSIFIAFNTLLWIHFVTAVPIHQGTVITASIMPMVPGVAITNAIRDTLKGDYMSGGSRAVEAFVTASMIAIGIAIGLAACQYLLGGGI